jgi:hypothetical protein
MKEKMKTKRVWALAISLFILGRLDVAAAGGQCVDGSYYHSYPLIVKASIRDIHESGLNGPEGFAYFIAAGSEKRGDLPASLGGLSGWQTNVWASNFQGPRAVSNTRMQWEWTADGRVETSARRYPAVYCQQTVDHPARFTVAAYTIKEDDDSLNPDDYVGKVQIDHRYCQSEVFDRGLRNGWTPERATPGINDVVSTSYQLYCSTHPTCTVEVTCPDGRILSCSVAGSCAMQNCSSGPDYVVCGGRRQRCNPLCPPRDPSCGSGGPSLPLQP